MGMFCVTLTYSLLTINPSLFSLSLSLSFSHVCLSLPFTLSSLNLMVTPDGSEYISPLILSLSLSSSSISPPLILSLSLSSTFSLPSFLYFLSLYTFNVTHERLGTLIAFSWAEHGGQKGMSSLQSS